MNEDLSPVDRELLRSITEIKTSMHLMAVKEALELHVMAVENVGKAVVCVAGGLMSAEEAIKTIERLIEPLEEPTRMVKDFVNGLK